MYQCFLDFEEASIRNNINSNDNKSVSRNSNMKKKNEFQHVTVRSEDEVRCTLGYIAVRLAHLSHDAMGDSKAAARLYKDAVRIDPSPSSVSWHGIGTSIEAWSAGANLDQAIDAYREARRLSPESYRVAFDLAVALERSGETEEAEAIMEKLRRGGADANSLVDSWGYVRWHTRLFDPESLNLHRGTRAMLQLALDEAWDLIHQTNGLVCEFGVASGRSMRMTKEILPLDTPAHGFDTFTGLPQGKWCELRLLLFF